MKTIPSKTSSLGCNVSIKRTIKAGNGDFVGVEIMLFGITPDTTDAEMDEMLEGNCPLAYSKVKGVLNAKIKEFV